MTQCVSTSYLTEILHDSRRRTLELMDGLREDQLIGPRLETLNPLRWEIGHVAYFHEYFILRRLYGRESLLGPKADALYDSIAVAHDTRWDLPLLDTEETLEYMQQVQDHLIERLPEGMASEQDSFIYQFAAFHEDMHTEAFTWARQTLAYPKPNFSLARDVSTERLAGPCPGFVDIPGGQFRLGAAPDAPFLFDNEKWSHVVKVEPFSIARAPVTNGEFSQFVDDGGYENDEFWSEQGWQLLKSENRNHPGYWQREAAGIWTMRRFEDIIPLPVNEPVIHISWHEAVAYCQWAGLRLPSEVEWEVAALGEATGDGTLSGTKRRCPWGERPPTPQRANLDGRALGCVDVGALADGDSAFGCRQMLGNVWEWTSDVFNPFPGFEPDAYEEYSTWLFGKTRVLKGGAWPTRSRMMHGTYRNYFEPHRWNIFSGFRTCRN